MRIVLETVVLSRYGSLLNDLSNQGVGVATHCITKAILI